MKAENEETLRIEAYNRLVETVVKTKTSVDFVVNFLKEELKIDCNRENIYEILQKFVCASDMNKITKAVSDSSFKKSKINILLIPLFTLCGVFLILMIIYTIHYFVDIGYASWIVMSITFVSPFHVIYNIVTGHGATWNVITNLVLFFITYLLGLFCVMLFNKIKYNGTSILGLIFYVCGIILTTIIFILAFLKPVIEEREPDQKKSKSKESASLLIEENNDIQYLLGISYLTGNGVEKDGIKAAKCFHQSEEEGNSGAQHSLGVCYSMGKGVKK